ncbi:hypothetical protein TNCV_3885581 [Trichonephila clavipes]|nr:hypothetical protein TNCV_3885581 [Trichonephila clavipes]
MSIFYTSKKKSNPIQTFLISIKDESLRMKNFDDLLMNLVTVSDVTSQQLFRYAIGDYMKERLTDYTNCTNLVIPPYTTSIQMIATTD